MEWISGDPGVEITGAYGCGYEGQTYSSLLDSCSNRVPMTHIPCLSHHVYQVVTLICVCVRW